MRRFLLERVEDATGVSGTGWVAEGMQFTNGRCVLCWRFVQGQPLPLGQWSSVAVYPSLGMIEQIHGHGGKTVIRMIDEHDPEHELHCPAIYAGGLGCVCGFNLTPTAKGKEGGA